MFSRKSSTPSHEKRQRFRTALLETLETRLLMDASQEQLVNTLIPRLQSSDQQSTALAVNAQGDRVIVYAGYRDDDPDGVLYRQYQMNQVTDRILTGTLAELLVQARLLQYSVQAAPPIKDSGNDLIAVAGGEFRAVSVRTATTCPYSKPVASRLYHVLAVVHLVGDDRDVSFDNSQIFQIPSEKVASASTDCANLDQYNSQGIWLSNSSAGVLNDQKFALGSYCSPVAVKL